MIADAELRTLRIVGALLATHDSWAHRLVVAAGAGAAAAQIAPAASIAGSASIVVEADAAVIKAAHRQGSFDFVVNTLDEALRTLKNEIRQGRPLAVGLIADEAAALDEAIERGLRPDACFLLPATPPALGQRLAALAAPIILLDDNTRSQPLDEWLAKHGLAEHAVSNGTHGNADTPHSIASANGAAAAANWHRQAPLYLRSARAGVHWTWL